MSEGFIEEMKYLAAKLQGTVTINTGSVTASFQTSSKATQFVERIDSRGYSWKPLTARSIQVTPF